MKTLLSLSILLFSGNTFADTFVVTGNSMSWSPDEITVVPGDVVRFEYGTGYPHTATSGTPCSPDGLFDAHIDSPGEYFEWTVPVDAPAEVPFFCSPHCVAGMTGMIYVELPEGHMEIGLVEISNPSHLMYMLNTSTDSATLSVACDGSLSSSFAIGVEIDETDIDVVIAVSGSESAYMLHPASGTDTVLTSGTYTLSAMEKYMFHGSTSGKNTLGFSISWTETGFEEGVDMTQIHLMGQGSVNSSGDSFAMYAANSDTDSYLTIEGEGEMFLGLIGDVTCSTLTLPASGEEGKVTVPAGTHVITVGGLGMLWIPDEGGDGGGFAEDVDGDGVVGIGDILAIIAAWGATSP